MKKWAGLVVCLIVGFVIWILLSTHRNGPASPPQKTVEEQNAAVAHALANQDTNTIAIIQSNFARVHAEPDTPAASAVTIVTPQAGPPAPLQFTNLEPVTVMQNMSRAIHQYGEMFGGNPVGDNQEITSQLKGKNPKHINFVTEEAGMSVNGDGELVDPWGTPYFFHQISGADTEIHSAGPDRIMWTSDDIVAHATQ
ncbi:MAG TPA: hypothetical protein VH280_19170 [Verrucomicrobiae bacterium]|jgi:hypothetical protein|nr:hypothetical protein [Verrucomicrobiae bacterium]